MAKEETLNPQNQGQSYEEVLAGMSVEQKDNTIKQLDRQCGLFAQENQKLKEQLKNLQASEFYIILEWNHRIATDKSDSYSEQFREECRKRVMDMMTPPKVDNKENTDGE